VLVDEYIAENRKEMEELIEIGVDQMHMLTPSTGTDD